MHSHYTLFISVDVLIGLISDDSKLIKYGVDCQMWFTGSISDIMSMLFSLFH